MPWEETRRGAPLMLLPDPDAVTFCAYGAVWQASRIIVPGPSMYAALRRLAEVIGTEPTTLTFWNDQPGRTRGHVLEAFDNAIIAESEGD